MKLKHAAWLIASVLLTPDLTRAADKGLGGPVAPGSSANWELKGIALGTTQEDFKAKFPEAQCYSDDDRRSECVDLNVTVLDRKAALRAHYLDGKAVYVGFERLRQDQMVLAGRALKTKFGQASHEYFVDATVHRGAEGVQRIRIEYLAWLDGDVLMDTNAENWLDKKVDYTCGQVKIINVPKVREWDTLSEKKSNPAVRDI
ncbi:MAG: hypothetical protein JSS25_05150 [Proteobacteria bacterium]|nr:hypothetical protein [Pseudomonadota bacterium]